MNRPILCLGLLAVLTLDGVASGVPWTWVAPKPQGNEMRASAYDAQRDLTVVVGEYGTVMTRTGSGEWQVHQVRTGGRFSCITWTGQVFIAGSESGGLFRSLDGVNWSRIRIGQFSDGPNAPPSSSGGGYWDLNGDQLISAIATGTNGVTVALAGESVWVSSDAERRTWQKQKLPNTSSDPWWSYYSDLEFGKGLFVAVGLQGSIVTSTNGISWTKRTSGTRRELDYMAFNGTYFVALDSDRISRSSSDYDETDAQVVRSSDGLTWAPINPAWPGFVQRADYALTAGPWFVVADYQAMWISGDYSSWTEVPDEPNVFYYDVHGTGPTSGGRTLVFARTGAVFSLDPAATSLRSEIAATGLGYGASIGGSGNLLAGENNWSALDGQVGQFIDEDFWPSHVFQQKGFLIGVRGNYSDTKEFAHLERDPNGTGRWVIKGSGTISDEVVSLAAASSFGPAVCITRWQDYGGDVMTTTYSVHYSADWNTWESGQSFSLTGFSPTSIQLEHDGQRFIMLTAEGRVSVSTDGREWTDLPPLPDDSATFRLRFHGGDSYVPRANVAAAIASNGQRLVVKGEKWRNEGDYSYSIASVDGRFFIWDFAAVAPGWKEIIAPWASIPDGLYSSGRSASGFARTIVWNGNRFVCLPQEFSPMREPQAGRASVSADGETWTQHEMPTQAVHLAWTGSQFVATTEYGGVLTHPDGLSPEIVSNLRIVSQPSSVEAFNGETVTFEVVVETDLPGLAYQWFKNDRPIKGATRSFLNVRSSPSAVGRYHVMLTAAEGAREFSAPAFLSLRSPATWSWQDGLEGDRVITAAPGGRVDLALTEVVGPPGGITYQWFKDGKAIPGQTRASLALSNISLASAGVYTAVITTSAGKVTTEMRRLVVEDGSLLIYTVKGRASVQRSVGGAAGRENLSGYLVVDRSAANPRTALIWIRRDGGQAAYRTEVLANAVMHSTGPGANSTSVLSHAITEGSYPRQNLLLFWLSGTDRLVKIGTTASTFAPSTMSGWVNSVGHSAAGSTIQTVNVALMLDRTLTSTLRLSSLEAAVESLEDTLMERGIYPSSE